MKIGIVGLGLIGSSIAKALAPTDHIVYGHDNSQTVCDHGQEIALVNDIKTLEEMASICDLVVLCVPSRQVIEMLDVALSGTAVVTDVASVKNNIFEYVSSMSNEKQLRFYGGHPMAGSEQSGIKAGRADLFRGRLWISVPPAGSDLSSFALIKDFISMLGAEQTILSAQEHDDLVAYASHLPQLAASSLMDLARGKSQDNVALLRLVAGGFRDMTRVASSNPQIWNDIVKENSQAITNSLNEYIDVLSKVRDDVKNHNFQAIAELFDRARKARIELPESAKLEGEYDEIVVNVKNEPGTIEQIITLAKNINIYDIKIAHSPNGAEGLMTLLVDSNAGQDFETSLSAAKFDVTRSKLTIS